MAKTNNSLAIFYGNGTWTAPAGVNLVNVQANRFWAPGIFQTGGMIDLYGRMWGSGVNLNGQLGNNASTTVSSPVLVVGGLNFKKVLQNGGKKNSIGLTTSGTMYGWGSNDSGQAGDGSSTPRSSPVLVVGGLLFSDFAANQWANNIYGRTSGGQLYAWGQNVNGELGVNDVTPRSSPVLVVGGLVFSKVIRSMGNSLLTPGSWVASLDVSGNCYCWGYNGNGNLGDGTSTTRSSPVLVAGGLTFQDVQQGGAFPSASIGTNFNFAIGLTTAGAAYGWGANTDGELGVNDRTARSSPVLVVGGLTFAKIFSTPGCFQSFGLTTTGKLYCWGQNLNGELGVNDTNPRSSPVLVVGGLTFTNVFLFPCTNNGGNQASAVFGLQADGTLYAWGSNNANAGGAGQLAVGDSVQRSSPTLVVGGLKFKTVWNVSGEEAAPISSSSMFGMALDGRVYAWGGNRNGELGLGDTTPRSSPVLIQGGLGAAPLDTTTDFMIPVIPGTVYNITFGTNGASFGGVVVGQQVVDSISVNWTA